MDSVLVERMNQLSDKVRLILENSENLKRAIAERMTRRAAKEYLEAREAPEAPEAPEVSEASDSSSEESDDEKVTEGDKVAEGDKVDYDQKATEPLEMSDSDVGTAFEVSSDDESDTGWCCCGRRS